MKKYIRTKKPNKSNVSASWKKGYADAAAFAKKYPKAIKELG